MATQIIEEIGVGLEIYLPQKGPQCAGQLLLARCEVLI
jgi:hypothetical protein